MKTFEPDCRALAAELFRYLVTPTGTKIALTLNDMLEYTGLVRDKVEPVLEQLGSGEVRILREVKGPLGDQATTRHEIFHDVLAGVILDWRRRYSTEQSKRAAEAKAEAARLEELQKAEQRRRQELAAADAARRRVQIRAVGSLLCVTTVLSTVAIYQAIQADRKAKFATKQERIAKERTAFAINQKRIADEQTKNADNEQKKAKDEAQRLAVERSGCASRQCARRRSRSEPGAGPGRNGEERRAPRRGSPCGRRSPPRGCGRWSAAWAARAWRAWPSVATASSSRRSGTAATCKFGTWLIPGSCTTSTCGLVRLAPKRSRLTRRAAF